MPIREMPQFKAVPDKMLEIPQPAIGGLNLKDLEFEQEVNQSPYLLNVMYRNGAFGKRYGQEVYLTASNEIYDAVYFDGFVFIHSGTKIYRCSGDTQVEVGSGLPESKGLFIIFAQKLYYLISSGFYAYSTTFTLADTYIPDFMINLKPDGSVGGDVIDDLNLIGNKANYIFNGETGVTAYNLTNYDKDPEIIDWDVTPTIEVEGEATTAFTVDKNNKTINFTTAPDEGDMNVVMTFTLKSSVHATEKAKILSCKFYDTFGGAQNSRLFLAGAGNSIYYWSQAFDLTYFPENNWARLGNTEDDITGFGRQYNVLIVFKPREVYSVYSYTETSSTTVIEENIGMESFRSQLVNPRVGCDAPYSIQLINNLLTWYNSNEGICTLVSTNVQDERNVRVISRNIERTNNFGVKGILDYDETPSTIQSVDYNNKYFLVFPLSGMCFMWDYEISPYKYSTSSGETNPRELDWFLFDNFYVKQFLKVGKQLVYINGYSYTDSATATNIMKYGDFADVSKWRASYGNISVNDNKLTYVCTETSYNIYLYPATAELDFEVGHSYLFMADITTSRSTDDFVIRLYKNQSYSFITNRTSLTAGEKKRVALTVNVDKSGPNVGIYMYFSASYGNQLEAGDTVVVENYMLIDMTESFGDNFGPKIYALKSSDYLTYNTPTTFTYGQDFTKSLCKLNASYTDLDIDGDGEGDPIHSYYMTPFMQFGAVEYLKNIKNMYVQCRGDSNTKIDLYYYTDDSTQPEKDPESIMVGGGLSMWQNFSWESFGWFVNIWGNTFRRKCNIKKVQMASMYFDNNEYSDMSITHIGMDYQLVKKVR